MFRQLIITSAALTVLLSASAQAADLTCKKSTNAPGQGPEVIVSISTATLMNKGVVIAKMRLMKKETSKGSDAMTVSTFDENKLNGRRIVVTVGGIANLKIADIQLGGFAGYTSILKLDDCWA